MYLAHFGLSRRPFEMSPDPYFFFPTAPHQEALAGLVYGITARKGFLVLSGEVGTGKSLLVRCLLDALDRRRVACAYVFNSLLSPGEFLEYIAEDLGVARGNGSKSDLLLRLNRHLIENHRQGLTTVAVVDEAHLLGADVLEEIRLLTNLETPEGKLLQIALVGQPELDAALETHELRQLKQRISLRLRLRGLTISETFLYIRSRLAAAGAGSREIFTPAALWMLHSYSSGIPRLINTLADNSLLASYAAGKRDVSAEFVEEAATDLRVRPAERPRAASARASRCASVLRPAMELRSSLETVPASASAARNPFFPGADR
jgi:general secretion pathway protein A